MCFGQCRIMQMRRATHRLERLASVWQHRQTGGEHNMHKIGRIIGECTVRQLASWGPGAFSAPDMQMSLWLQASHPQTLPLHCLQASPPTHQQRPRPRGPRKTGHAALRGYWAEAQGSCGGGREASPRPSRVCWHGPTGKLGICGPFRTDFPPAWSLIIRTSGLAGWGGQARPEAGSGRGQDKRLTSASASGWLCCRCRCSRAVFALLITLLERCGVVEAEGTAP